MELKYVKAANRYWYPQEPGVQMEGKNIRPGVNYPVCYIKKIPGGRIQIDFHDDSLSFSYENYIRVSRDEPNSRIIIYPSGIEEIGYVTVPKYEK